MKLSTSQRSALDQAVEHAPVGQLLVFAWWTLFNERKAQELIDNVESGMIWKAAYARAKRFERVK